MGMTRAAKETEIAQLKERLEGAEIVVLTHNKGLDAKSITDLRLQMRENGVQFKVVKNTLAKIALKGTQYEQITDMFAGPIAMATAGDPVSASKVAHEFAKKNDRLVIVGGAYGDMLLDEAAVKQLASLPSLDELRSKIAGLLQAPSQKIAQITQIPAQQLVGVTKAYSEKV